MKTKCIAIEWKAGLVEADITVAHGKLSSIRILKGKGRHLGKGKIIGTGSLRAELRLTEAKLDAGAFAARLTVSGKPHGFTFFARDVNQAQPIYMPAYGVMVTAGDDQRSYDEVEAVIRGQGLTGKGQRIENEREETFENACRHNRSQLCPTWLGLSRDMRLFEVGHEPRFGYGGYVRPRYHGTAQSIPESDDVPYVIVWMVGAGSACRCDITRRLDDGVLPILHATQREENVDYHITAFCTLEKRLLSAKSLRGSEWQACYPNTMCNILSPEERGKINDLLHGEMRAREEETVCALRIEAVNKERTPQYAWFKAGRLQHPCPETGTVEGGMMDGCPLKSTKYDGVNGFGILKSGRIFAVHRINAAPMPEEEMAILLQPGENAVFEILIPHQPLPRARATRLMKLDYCAHLNACRNFWRGKLADAAAINVPEPAVNERIQAGLLHCDVVALGREPDGTVLPTIGWYTPIGTESSPIIQFFDSMGWHKLAERSLQFFLDRQRDDGFIQSTGYQSETGPVLWSMGEHYRYTHDDAWVKRIRPNVRKACDYLLKWRERNKRPELRGQGYGLLDGRVADPVDCFHSFMLNGLSYLGILRASEMLAKNDPTESKRLDKEAREFKQDIRTAFHEAMTRSLVVPIGDGTWVSSAAPWAEHPAGAVALYAEGGKMWTHHTFGAHDSIIGALWLVIAEVLDPDEIDTEALLKSHQALMTVRNAGLSQPYYCRHDYIHLRRGEVKAFLKTYYNQFTALQDRETYTFWEHYSHASQHKTHEEGWFLMQTRWMLWLEQDTVLKLLQGIPRIWMEHGKSIDIKNAASYFGSISLHVESCLDIGHITAKIECQSKRRPDSIEIRIPHPDGRKARRALGGIYDPLKESVTIDPFHGDVEVRLEY